MPSRIDIIRDKAAGLLIPCMIALPVSLAVGTVDALFGRVLLAVGAFRSQHIWILIPLLPLAGAAIVWLYRGFGKNAGRGMGLVFDTGHGKEDGIPLRLVPLIMISTWITHLFGGSAGREGVAVQMGATISHWVGSRTGKRLGCHMDGKVLVMLGMAAGFAGLFRTPIAATLFALEVLHVGRIEHRALMPALIASFCASATSGALGLEKFQFAIAAPRDIDALLIMKVLVLGALFGIVGALFSWLLARAKRAAAAHLENPSVRIICIGAGVALSVLILFSGRYAGLGTNLISLSLTGGDIQVWDWALKLLLTVATLAAGFQGGEVTPLFSIGASLGCVLAPSFGLDAGLGAALGYAAVFGSATNTLLAPTLIGAEVFGFQATPLFFIACAAAFTCNFFNQTIYPGQIRRQDLPTRKQGDGRARARNAKDTRDESLAGLGAEPRVN